MSFLENIFKEDSHEIIGLNTELKSLYILNKFKKKINQLFTYPQTFMMLKIYSELTHHTDKVWFFPMDDFITSVAVAASPELKVTRLETIDNTINNEKGIVITNLMGYLRFLPSKEKFKQSYITLETGKEYDMEELIEKLFNLGYRKETTVNMTGEIATRGFCVGYLSFKLR